jgi:hypothetical protein
MAEKKKTTTDSPRPRKTAAKKVTVQKETTPIVSSSESNGKAGGTHIIASNPKPANISREEIARLAHQFWAERGHQHGKHEEDWYRAEQELRKRAS